MNYLVRFKNQVLNNPLEYLFYLFIFLLPWQVRWIVQEATLNGEVLEYGRISLYAFDIVLLIWLFSFVVFSIIKDNSIKFSFNKIVLALALFCLYAVLSIFWAEQEMIAFIWSARMVLGLAMFGVLQKIIFSRVRLAVVVAMAGALQGFLAIWQFFSQSVWASKWLGIAEQSARFLGVSVVEFGIERWLRAYGSLPHPNILGALMVLVLVALFVLIAHIEKRQHKIFILSITALTVLGLWFSFSRAAWLVAGLVLVGGVFLFYFYIRDKWLRQFVRGWLGFVLLLVVFSTVASWSLVETRLHLGHTERLEMKSNIDRLAGYTQARQVFERNYPIGTGLGNYVFAIEGEYSGPYRAFDIHPVHSSFLLITAELGLMGLVLLVLALGGLVYCLVKYRKWVYLALLVVWLALAQFDHFWWTNATGVYVSWLIIAIIYLSFQEKQSSSAKWSGK